jgi:hypothetical protein
LPQRASPADPDRLGRVGQLLAPEVERLVLDEDDRVGVSDRAGEQAAGVGGAARHHHLQTQNVGEPALETLGVLGRAALSRASLRAQHERHLKPVRPT